MSEASLAPGLYIVATPIGAARDITLRALDILRDAEVIAAEDTRTARKLMEIHGITLGDRPLIAYHDHNGPAVRPRLVQALSEGRSVAYVSDAGTPLVADPGYRLVGAAVEAGLPVTAAPGPSAVLAALTLSGLPSDRFLFAGFPPTASGARRTFLAEFRETPATLVFFESPKRCAASLLAMAEALGAERPAALCRELTKRHEEVRRATLAELAQGAEADPPRGEVVIVVDRARGGPDEAALEQALGRALETMTTRDAADAVAAALGLPRRKVYQAALKLSAKE